jgi:hypothetical protein
MPEFVYLALAGAFGALAKDCVEDNKIQLPYLKDGYFFMGFIGGMLVGAFVGYVVDNNLLTAALGGYAGTAAIEHLLSKAKPE